MANEAVEVKAKKSKRLTEEQLAAKYPHLIPGSLSWDEGNRKQTCRAKCTVCGAEFTVYTSDLFQVNMCETHRAEARKAKAAEKRAAAKAAVAALKA